MAPAVHYEPPHITDFGASSLIKLHYDNADSISLERSGSLEEQELHVEHSGPQGAVVPFTLVDDPCAWKANDFKRHPEQWSYTLSPQDVEEIRHAVKAFKRLGRGIKETSKTDFPLPILGPRLEAFRDEVIHGKGFQLIRGFPVDQLTREEVIQAYFAFGLYWGTPQPQNRQGHLVGHIKAIGTDSGQISTRPYTTPLAQPYHTDRCDLVSLVCLAPAAEGGLSSWSSSVAVHNELLKRGRQDIVKVLNGTGWYLPMHRYIYQDPKEFKLDGEDATYHDFAPIHYHDGYLSIPFSGYMYYKSQKWPEAPKLTPKHHEALGWLTAYAKSDDLRMDATLEKGDIQLLNNTTMLHTRTAFKDGQDEGHKRHLLRLWIATPSARRLPAYFDDYWGSTKIGQRGAFYTPPGTEFTVPLDPVYGD